jgi:hypothetical protein
MSMILRQNGSLQVSCFLSWWRLDSCSRQGMRQLFVSGILLLAGMLMTGCHKGLSAKGAKSSATNNAPDVPAIVITSIRPHTNEQFSLDLGVVTLTNHSETCVALGSGRNCRFTPLMIDRHNVQLTLTVEATNGSGKMQDLSVTQVTTKTDEPFEVEVGEFSFSFTPKVISE